MVTPTPVTASPRRKRRSRTFFGEYFKSKSNSYVFRTMIVCVGCPECLFPHVFHVCPHRSESIRTEVELFQWTSYSRL